MQFPGIKEIPIKVKPQKYVHHLNHPLFHHRLIDSSISQFRWESMD